MLGMMYLHGCGINIAMLRTRPLHLKLLSATAFALSLGVPGQAENAMQGPLVEEGAQVDFGLVAASDQAGTIAITPSGGQLCSPGLSCLGGQHEGVIYVTGRKDELATIVIGDALLTNGSATMLARFTPSEPYLVLRPGRRKNSFTVIGTLSIEPHQSQGTYEGSYDIIVEYQ